MAAAGQDRRKSTAPAPPVMPDELKGAVKVADYALKDVPTKDDLANFLNEKGLDTKDWGQGNTKSVAKYWKEIQLDEAGLEVWRKANGDLQPVRTVHVLRAKVTSPEAFKRGIFLFNTWQQYGDGRKRTRNGLLSEKLSMSEMPFEEHVHEVCERAVTEEEMQRLTEASLKIGPASAAPEYDPSYVCPLKVVHENFIDHIIEIEVSKSYPGLLTMYHLYTVDIICTGLPSVDFNTLEFDHPDENGHRKLKYVHAWVWLDWAQIQRYLLEGSELKETKIKGSFSDLETFQSWLSQFDVDLDGWGKGQWKTVLDLYTELESEACQLELWGRQDGAPLLMRVAHVIQIKVTSRDPRLYGKHLLHMWTQNPDGQVTTQHRLLAKKISVVHKTSKDCEKFDKDRFIKESTNAVIEYFEFLSDAHHQLDPSRLPTKEDAELEKSAVQVFKVDIIDQRSEVEESPSFKGMHTMYHLYTMEVVCDGLPDADFTSAYFGKRKPLIHGWSWVTWYKTMDMYNAQRQGATRRDQIRHRTVAETQRHLAELAASVQRLADKLPEEDTDADDARFNVADLRQKLGQLEASYSQGDRDNASSYLPPSMISKMASQTMTTDKLLEEVEYQNIRRGLSALGEGDETVGMEMARSLSSATKSATPRHLAVPQ